MQGQDDLPLIIQEDTQSYKSF